MASRNNRYDIILLYTQFRVLNYYLNLIKQLSGDFAIGILNVISEREDAHSVKAKRKIIQTDRMFLNLCQKFGADILKTGQKYVCKLLLIPQYNYRGYEADYIDRNKTIALHRFGSGLLGLSQLKDMGAMKIFVYEKGLFIDMLASENGSHFKNEFEIVEMGTPYAKYPAFDFQSLNIDYIIAYPTVMLLREPDKKWRLFENIIRLVNSLPEGTRVCLKLHNVRDGGYVISDGQRFRTLSYSLKKALNSMTTGVLSSLPNWAQEGSWVGKLYVLGEMLQSSILEEKVIFLSDLTERYNLGLEHFLPYVKKRVITGISSCIWHSLYQRLPVYNCDNQPLREDMPNYAVYKNFYVPSCHGKMDFHESYFNKVSESARKADLIELIRKEL